MKTAISVEDSLLSEADSVARRIGVSRSRLFSLALESYLAARRDQEITEQLNRVYSKAPAKSERQTLSRMKAKFRSTIVDQW